MASRSSKRLWLGLLFQVCCIAASAHVVNAISTAEVCAAVNGYGLTPSTHPTVSVVTIAGGPGNSGFNDAVGTAARFNKPRFLFFHLLTGYLYVSDLDNHRIRSIDAATGAVATLAGTGSSGSVDNADPLSAQFNKPAGITFDYANNLMFVAGEDEHKVRKIDFGNGNAVGTAAGTGKSGSNNSPNPLNAKMDKPLGLAYSSTDDLVFFVDSGNSKIRAFGSTGGDMVTIATGIDAYGLTWDPTGNLLYLHDQSGNFKTLTTGGAATDWGTGTDVRGLDGDYVNGYVYAADDHAIRRKSTSGGSWAVVAGSSGNSGMTNHATDPTSARFDTPYGIAVDTRSGGVYVADWNNHVIRGILGVEATCAATSTAALTTTTAVATTTATTVAATTTTTVAPSTTQATITTSPAPTTTAPAPTAAVSTTSVEPTTTEVAISTATIAATTAIATPAATAPTGDVPTTAAPTATQTARVTDAPSPPPTTRTPTTTILPPPTTTTTTKAPTMPTATPATTSPPPTDATAAAPSVRTSFTLRLSGDAWGTALATARDEVAAAVATDVAAAFRVPRTAVAVANLRVGSLIADATVEHGELPTGTNATAMIASNAYTETGAVHAARGGDGVVSVLDVRGVASAPIVPSGGVDEPGIAGEKACGVGCQALLGVVGAAIVGAVGAAVGYVAYRRTQDGDEAAPATTVKTASDACAEDSSGSRCDSRCCESAVSSSHEFARDSTTAADGAEGSFVPQRFVEAQAAAVSLAATLPPMPQMLAPPPQTRRSRRGRGRRHGAEALRKINSDSEWSSEVESDGSGRRSERGRRVVINVEANQVVILHDSAVLASDGGRPASPARPVTVEGGSTVSSPPSAPALRRPLQHACSWGDDVAVDALECRPASPARSVTIEGASPAWSPPPAMSLRRPSQDTAASPVDVMLFDLHSPRRSPRHGSDLTTPHRAPSSQ